MDHPVAMSLIACDLLAEPTGVPRHLLIRMGGPLAVANRNHPHVGSQSSGFDDLTWVPGQRIAARPDRTGSGRVGRASFGATRERAGAAGPRHELRGDREGVVAGRRHRPHLASSVRRGRDRGPGELWLRGQCMPLERRAAGQAEGLDHRGAAADDA